LQVHLQSNQFFTEPNATAAADDSDDEGRAEKLLNLKADIEDLFEGCTVLA
jgi:hypothetical protein